MKLLINYLPPMVFKIGHVVAGLAKKDIPKIWKKNWTRLCRVFKEQFKNPKIQRKIQKKPCRRACTHNMSRAGRVWRTVAHSRAYFFKSKKMKFNLHKIGKQSVDELMEKSYYNF